MPSEEELQRTIEACWASIQPRASEVERHPNSTIEPVRLGGDTAADRAVGLLKSLAPADTARFELGATLGEGGMGIVRLATQATVGRQVAIKTLKPDVKDADAMMRLLREAWVTGMLEHPNIIPIYDVGIDRDGRPQIVLKKIEGVEWGALLHDKNLLREHVGKVDPREWHLRVLMQVCNAVHFAHSRGIVHRDLKPENVMIGEFGEVIVVDWGIAVSLRDGESEGRIPQASQSRDMAGTPAYMAPEMLGGDPPRLSERTDVYLLGSMLFEIFAGRPPHEGNDLRAILVSVLKSPPKMTTKLPSELARVCTRAMAAEPADRYESAEEFRIAIEEYLEHRGSMRLAESAQSRLGDLFEEIDECGVTGKKSPRVYELYRECRFGLLAAIDAWADNAAARGSLTLATTRLAELELAQKDPQAAATLLSELEEPPPNLVKKVEQALSEKNAESARLEAMQRDLDPMIGSRTRTFGTLVMGSLWTGLPIAAQFLIGKPDHDIGVVISIFFLLVAVGFGYWARESMGKTSLNRTVFWAIVFTMLSQVGIRVGAHLAGIDATLSMTFHFLLWLACAGFMTIFVDRRFAPMTVGYMLGFWAAAAWPDYVFLVAGLSHGVLTINTVWLWAPLVQKSRETENRAERAL